MNSVHLRPERCDGRPELGAREVQLWWIKPETGHSDEPLAWPTLCASERERAARLRPEAERLRYLLRRSAMREILGCYLDMPPQALVFRLGRFGKPALAALAASPGMASLSFNMSRSGGAAVLAVARGGRLGVDIERPRPMPEIASIVRRSFSHDEARVLAAMEDVDRTESFFRLWTRKEAVVKALGGGLEIALDTFDVSYRQDEAPAITQWRLANSLRGTLRLLAVEPVQGHAIALAAEGPVDMCRLLRWPQTMWSTTASRWSSSTSC